MTPAGSMSATTEGARADADLAGGHRLTIGSDQGVGRHGQGQLRLLLWRQALARVAGDADGGVLRAADGLQDRALDARQIDAEVAGVGLLLFELPIVPLPCWRRRAE